jgi:hypothetical protein
MLLFQIVPVPGVYCMYTYLGEELVPEAFPLLNNFRRMDRQPLHPARELQQLPLSL